MHTDPDNRERENNNNKKRKKSSIIIIIIIIEMQAIYCFISFKWAPASIQYFICSLFCERARGHMIFSFRASVFPFPLVSVLQAHHNEAIDMQ